MLVEPLNSVGYKGEYHLPGCKPFNIAEDEIVQSLLAAKAIKPIKDVSLDIFKKIPGINGKIAKELVAFGIDSVERLKKNIDTLVEIKVPPKTIAKIRQHFEKE